MYVHVAPRGWVVDIIDKMYETLLRNGEEIQPTHSTEDCLLY